MLIDHMHPPFLMGHAFALTSFHKTGVLVVLVSGAKLIRKLTHCMLSFISPHHHKGVVAFLDMDAEEVLCWKVLSTFETSVQVELVVVRLVLAVGPECERLSVRGEGAFHCHGSVLVLAVVAVLVRNGGV